MRREYIDSWLSGVLEQEQNPTPPLTPPPNLDRSYRAKRRKMSHRETSTSRKHRLNNDTTSSVTDLTDRTKFDPSIQSSSGTSRQRSPVRDLLNELPLSSPSIHCTRPKPKYIPKPPDEAIDIPDAAFDDDVSLKPEELDALWQDVTEIYNEAAEAEEHG
ncbi:hypothetical protein BJX68DRAFT_97916 [Aspergillus pseudodeflectus]|uniref:Uncharacterized protein n=1 Tax=Aspergillus pseudodeflectus TaxID=176178 RepID=A0ABR4K9I4_9EURO